MLETAQLTWVNLLDPSTTKNRNPHLRKKIRSHVTRLQHARKQGTVLKRHPQQPPIPCYCPDNALFVDYEAWPSKEMEECTQPIDQNEDEITNQCYEIFQRSGTTTFTSVSSFEGFLSFDYNRCPSPRLLLDISDDLDVHLRRLGANVPEAFVSHPNVIQLHGPIARNADYFRSTTTLKSWSIKVESLKSTIPCAPAGARVLCCHS